MQHIRNKRDLHALCQQYGIKLDCNEIHSVKAKGYKGRFDSRHVEIIFLHILAARTFERALCHLQKNEKAFRKTNHATFSKSVKQSSYFKFLDRPHVLHTFSSNEPEDSWKVPALASIVSEARQHHKQPFRYWKVGTYNIQSIKNVTRLNRLNSFLNDEDIDCLALNETNWSGVDFSHHFQNYTWFGRKANRKQGGVGFLIKTCLIENVKVDTFNGKHSSDSYFMILKPQNARSTCFMTVYGQSSPTVEESLQQWNGFSLDLQGALSTAPPSTDTVFMGDINARVGRARDDAEASFIGKYGEPNDKRNAGGNHAIEFLQENNLICLNGRTASDFPPYTFHSRSQGHSLIDIIAISTNMWRSEYEASPLQITLTGTEDHLPVVTSLRMFRQSNKPLKNRPKLVWNVQALKSKRRSERFLTERNEKLTAFAQQEQNSQEEKLDYSSHTIEEKVHLLTEVIHGSALKHIRKRLVYHRYHLSRSEKKEKKLRKLLNAYSRKSKRQIRDPESNISNMFRISRKRLPHFRRSKDSRKSDISTRRFPRQTNKETTGD